MSDLDCHLAAIVAGNTEAFGRWVAGCELRLRASLAGFAGHVDVEAVLQETLLRVWQVAPRLRPDGKPDMLVRFAVRVARNHAVSELRRSGKAPPPDDDSVRPTEPDPKLREILLVCRDKLPAQPARALAERLTTPALADHAVAARVGMQKNTFLQNITRARTLLVACLERAGVSLMEVLV